MRSATEREPAALPQEGSPVNPSAPLRVSTVPFTTRPVIMGRRGVITTGHYLATAAGMRTYARGGNAVDAAVAAGLALAVVKPQANGIGGEVPILIYSPRTRRVVSISGQGTAPARATIEFFHAAGVSPIPGNGLLAPAVPAAFDAWITALREFGTLSLGEVMEPAMELATDGFAMYPALRQVIGQVAATFSSSWPTSAAIYLPDGTLPAVGERFRQTEWAACMSQTVEAESAALRSGADRSAALGAARDVFYQGPIAQAIARFAAETSVLDQSGRSHQGLMAHEDLAGYHTLVEEPVHLDYQGCDIYKCGPWTQGPVFLQQLRLLEGYDLPGLGHNSPAYVHLLVEAAKLAFADRETYYGDPRFASVPLERLLSREYAAERRQLIDPRQASMELRPGSIAPPDHTATARQTGADIHRRDTTHLDAIDADGLMISATPSGGWLSSSPVVAGLGFPLGTRLQMFSLDPTHPNALAPGKRPRTTLTPTLVLRDGEPHMVFGTPGGDQQDQWTLQFFLNVVAFGMDLQQAVDAATFHTDHFPSSFYPRAARPGSLVVEGRISQATRAALESLGHRVEPVDDWANGQVCAARFDPAGGRIEACASPRGHDAYAIGY